MFSRGYDLYCISSHRPSCYPYELIRPLVLFADRTARQRAQATHTHPDTIRTLRRRFQREGMHGLLPADVEVVPRRRASPVPEAVRQEIDRLKTLYDGFHDRELARHCQLNGWAVTRLPLCTCLPQPSRLDVPLVA